MVDQEMFQPTSLQPILHHFICNLCQFVVQDPRQCAQKSCSILFCNLCVQSVKGWKCPQCSERSMPVDMHRKLKEFITLLKFNCPGCSENMMYEPMLKHIENCEAAKKVQADGRDQHDVQKVDHAKVLMLRRETIANKFNQQVNQMVVAKGWQFPAQLFIFQKDNKNISILDTGNRSIVHRQVEFRQNFPHNFQMIQLGQYNPRVFMIGGGDYKSLPDSMFQCRELVPHTSSNQFHYQFIDKKRMQYARHGHSCVGIADTYIMVSGSRKEVSQASQKVELYDSNQDEWMELQNINEGRHYHSSCNFENKFIYIFGGIQNASKKYSNTIERLVFSLQTITQVKWTKISIGEQSFYQINQPVIAARQGAGMCQFSEDQILIVGGFNGRFLSDYYTFKIDPLQGHLSQGQKFLRQNPQNNLFPF